jgi:uncharacterized protein YtpQ (UPF0354 family)
MPHRYITPDDTGIVIVDVHHGEVLDVAALANFNAIDVAAQYAMEEHASVGMD